MPPNMGEVCPEEEAAVVKPAFFVKFFHLNRVLKKLSKLFISKCSRIRNLYSSYTDSGLCKSHI